jgi:AcrR family transcriptional regulator
MGITERRQREKNSRRKLILNAAVKVYFNEGYHSATVEKIAEAAEVSRATVYLYFKTRDEIFVYAAVEFMRSLADLLEKLARSHIPGQQDLLEKLFDVFLTFYRLDPPAFGLSLYLFQREMVRSLPGGLRLLLDETGSRNFQGLTSIARIGTDLGYFRPADPRTLAEMIFSAFLGIVHLENSKAAMGRKNHLEITTNLSLHALREGIVNPDYAAVAVNTGSQA